MKGEEGIRRAVVDAFRSDEAGSSHDLCRVSTVTGDNPAAYISIVGADECLGTWP